MYHYLQSPKPWSFFSLREEILSLMEQTGTQTVQDLAICVCVKFTNDCRVVKDLTEFLETIMVVEYPDGKKVPIIPERYNA